MCRTGIVKERNVFKNRNIEGNEEGSVSRTGIVKGRRKKMCFKKGILKGRGKEVFSEQEE